ncbi:MAG: hypothetical protein M3069_28320, partial [Chloroflexota bacterium]|nr:hypothetical protein [Chloroflexota bacterium]
MPASIDALEFGPEGIILDGNLPAAYCTASGALVPFLGDGAIDELNSSDGGPQRKKGPELAGCSGLGLLVSGGVFEHRAQEGAGAAMGAG